MESFLKNVIEGNGITPPDACIRAFSQNFDGAVNAEWLERNGFYEVSFYRHNIEHIAVFDSNGYLAEYIQNLAAEFLPVHITDIAKEKGEIMNALLRNRGNHIEYEVIIRDSNLVRYMLIFSDIGHMVSETRL